MQSLKYFFKVTANKIIREIKRNLKNCPAGGKKKFPSDSRRTQKKGTGRNGTNRKQIAR